MMLIERVKIQSVSFDDSDDDDQPQRKCTMACSVQLFLSFYSLWNTIFRFKLHYMILMALFTERNDQF